VSLVDEAIQLWTGVPSSRRQPASSYGATFSDLFRRTDDYVDKILRGAKASDLPVEQPRKFELIINLEAAKALRLAIPHSLLLRADEVIQ
jgi:putative ABC transport system substrate-binding protein